MMLDKCDFCGRILEEIGTETWRMDDGEEVFVPTSTEQYIIANTSRGELAVCSDCYKKKSGFAALTSGDMAEIHYEFGLEFLGKEMIEEAKRSLDQALEFSDEARIFAALGSCFEKSSRIDQAKVYWKRALTLDPNCAEARLNLDRFEGR